MTSSLPAVLLTLMLILPVSIPSVEGVTGPSGSDEPGPGLLYSSYLGGGDSDVVRDIVVDEDGYIYLTGDTYSEDFPTTPGAYDRSFNGVRDIYVAKFDPRGSDLLYSTFVGGSDNDVPEGMAVDGQGHVFITGRSESVDFPTTSGAYDEQHNGDSDVIVFQLDADGGDLLYSTFVGGSDYEVGAAGIALDEQGHAFVAGHTHSSDFPTTDGAYDRSYYCCGWDGFVFELNPQGSDLVYSTYFGGWDYDGARSIGVDKAGQVHLVGDTTSNDFETTTGSYDETYNGGRDGFALALEADGSDLVYSTFLGGTDDDLPNALDLLRDGTLWSAGYTLSQDYPTTADAFDDSLKGERAFFISGLNEEGTDLQYSTYIGGSKQDEADGLLAQGRMIHVSGRTYSEDFPVTDSAFQGQNNGGMDGVLLTLDTSRSGQAQLIYSSYYGGSRNERLWNLQLSNDRYISGGLTASEDLPVTENAYDGDYNGGPVDGLLMMVDTDPDTIQSPGGGSPGEGDNKVNGNDELNFPVAMVLGVAGLLFTVSTAGWAWGRRRRDPGNWSEEDW